MDYDSIKSTIFFTKKSSTILGYFFLVFYCCSAVVGYYIENSFGTTSIIFIIITLLIHILLYLNTEWSNAFNLLINFNQTNNIDNATHVYCETYKNKVLCEINNTTTKHIFLNFKKHIFNKENGKFEPLIYPNELLLNQYSINNYLLNEKVKEKDEYYGLNKCKIPIPSFFDLFKEQIMAPFFVFQIFCSILWLLDDMPMLAIMMFFMLFVFEGITTLTRVKNYGNFKAMAAMKPTKHFVLRNGNKMEVDCDHIYPGDIILLTTGKSIVDCVIIKGMCVVNEAILTGESTPHMRESITTIIDDNTKNNKFNINLHKQHVVYGGTDILQSEDCYGYVIHTGFQTAQGNLLRTIISSSERITANNMESFIVIIFLLIFAIIAAGYVFYDGIQNGKDFWKLLLSCVLIIINVVPPELPIELTNAINYSMLSLKKQFIYCTEPFRIPFAGSVDICAFDKTGTLTSDEVSVAGIVGISDDPFKLFTDTQEIDFNILNTLIGCNSLSKMKDGTIIGDPAEKVTLEFTKWSITLDNKFIPDKKSNIIISTIQRFPFSSVLKRMSVVSLIHDYKTQKKTYMSFVKGAPEILKDKFKNVPHFYDNVYKFYTLQGMRVLVFGSKEIDKNINTKYSRDDIENDLNFGGFILFTSSIKKDSLNTINVLHNSNHKVIMITGDSIYTAIHISNELKIINNNNNLLLNYNELSNKWNWTDIEGIEMFEFYSNQIQNQIFNYSICLSGDSFNYLKENLNQNNLFNVMKLTKVFARVNPQQKEEIIILLKKIGFTVLMCGDGTNDVGALKHSDVGVAILNTLPSEKEIKQSEMIKLGIVPMPSTLTPQAPLSNEEIQRRRNMTPQERQQFLKDNFKKLLEGLPDDESSIPKFGDASMASPFSCKSIEISPICQILKQGRCTLVTTQQMFRILALTCLVSAYDLSVIKLEGVKYGDLQMTVNGILMSICFLMLSNTQPLEILNNKHPTKSIFAPFHVLSVLSQALIHFIIIQFALKLSKDAAGPNYKPPKNDEFEPSIINTVIFLISNMINVTIFAVNYVGEPYRKNITEYKPLLYCLGVVFFLTVIFSSEMVPSLNELFKLVPFPTPTLKYTIILLLILDVTLSFIVERTLRYIFKFNQ